MNPWRRSRAMYRLAPLHRVRHVPTGPLRGIALPVEKDCVLIVALLGHVAGVSLAGYYEARGNGVRAIGAVGRGRVASAEIEWSARSMGRPRKRPSRVRLAGHSRRRRRSDRQRFAEAL